MTIVMYDLAGRDDRRFSPNCWRTRMALAHKGLAYEARATRFTDIPSICGGGQETIPVIDDRGTIVADSWVIANYLEESYPDRPSLFGGPGGRSLTMFVQKWVNSVLHAGLIGMMVLDIHDHLEPVDQDYFRKSREARFGRPLEAVQAGREDRLVAFRASLTPLRLTVAAQPFLGGDGPLYADYLAFGGFQWARAVSPLRLLDDGDPIAPWVERCRGLYDGLGRRVSGYD